MPWLTIAKYVSPLLLLLLVVWYIDDRAYQRGKGASELVCSQETVPAAKAEVQKLCEENLTITEEAYDALQTRFNSNDARYRRLLKQSTNAKCVPVTRSSERDNAAPEGRMSTLPTGVSLQWLADRARSADDSTAVGASCQRFVCGIYKTNHQESKLPKGACGI